MEPPTTIQPEGEVIWIGGAVDRTSASLRFFHDDLDPDMITRLLQHEPTHSQCKGDLLPSRRHQRVALTGSWWLKTAKGDDRLLEEQISGLLGQVSADPGVWEQLSRLHLSRMDVFCGLHLKAWNRGISLSAELVRRLGERHLEVNFDIYCPTEAEAEPSAV
jgi:hypothetical protein